MKTSVYIHIPFCKSICSYCAFSKMYYNESFVKRYLKSLRVEIEKFYKGEDIKTIYLGGGTPSSLKLDEISELFDIIKIFKINNLEEFTFECNINDINKKLLSLLKKNGVTRLSIGVESFNDNILKKLNRCHTSKMAIDNINIAKKYFDNINIDLIYGINEETLNDLKRDLEIFFELNLNHLSTYSLMIEEKTKFYNENEKTVDEDLDSEMYYYIVSELKKHDIMQYEISNFAKKGYESIHNLVYWNNEHYYGFGLSASGYIKNIRYTNTCNMSKYLENDYNRELESIDERLELEYELILGLRKRTGININKINEKYHIDLLKKYNIEKLIKDNLLEIINGNLIIKENKIYISNSIMIEFI